MKSVILLSLCACMINTLPSPITDQDATEYLKHFGYIPDTKPTENMKHGGLRVQPEASAMRSALIEFQRFAGIPETGVLDKDTTSMMKLPRCGVKDNTKFDEFTLEGSKWKKNVLNYHIRKYPHKKWKLSNAVVDDAIKRAFDVWADITPLQFIKQNSPNNVDIDIIWGAREHGDGEPFDGPSGTLAHAYFPQYGGDAHFDDDETWTVRTHAGINLFQVAVHEFGHSLGLKHSKVKTALMAPFYRGYVPNFQLDADDINGIKAIYPHKGKSACGECGDFSSKSGCVTSKNFPKDYSNNVDCVITIQPVAGHEMTVKFTHFDLEADASCQYDYLEIREEGGKPSKHCGKTIPTTITTSKKLTIKFHSDGSVIASGYKLEWTSLPVTVPCGECGDFSSASGCVISKNHPKNYPANTDCAITIQPEANKNIQLKFTHFDLEEDANCNYDYLEISEQGGKSHGKYCGRQSPFTITSSNKLNMRFYSDGTVQTTGYKFQWTSVSVSALTNGTDYSGNDYGNDYSGGVTNGSDYTGHYSGNDYTGHYSGNDYTGHYSGNDYTGNDIDNSGNDYAWK